MRILIVGGTRFVGRHLTEAALAGGHDVTLLHRGRTGGDLYPQATHLLADVIAHNIFVPEHEARLMRGGMMAHALSEWAMDEHLKGKVPDSPRDSLASEPRLLAEFVARAFRCDEGLAARALRQLGRADALLRASPLPRLCRRIVRLYERRLEQRFDSYVRRTTKALQSIERALAGQFVDWESSDPEGEARKRSADRRPRQHVAGVVQAEHHS
jgi:phytoene dehydrogenase-like protein